MAKTETVKQGTAPTFTKEQLAASKRYAPVRDLVGVLLEDGGQYTTAEVDAKIEAFRKGKVRFQVFPLDGVPVPAVWDVVEQGQLWPVTCM